MGVGNDILVLRSDGFDAISARTGVGMDRLVLRREGFD